MHQEMNVKRYNKRIPHMHDVKGHYSAVPNPNTWGCHLSDLFWFLALACSGTRLLCLKLTV